MNTWPPERLRSMFRAYADVDFPASGAPLYASIADGIAADDEVLSLAATVRDGQPPANLLFASVHRLLLSGTKHRLAMYYPDVTAEPLPPDAGAAAAFREFCLEHRESIVDTVRTRLVQTNVLERCGALLPAFALAARTLGSGSDSDAQTPQQAAGLPPLAMIEIGASAGLNLLWDRYFYDYGAVTWGDRASPVHLKIETRGDVPLPVIPPELRAGWSVGIDLDPVDLRDAESLLWQRALMWPERTDRQQRLEAARRLMDLNAPQIIRGDAIELLPEVLASAPPQMPLCVFASYMLYQVPTAGRARVLEILRAQAKMRPIAFVVNEIRHIGDPHGVLELTLADGDAWRTLRLAQAHPHGYWIEWNEWRERLEP